MILIFLLEIILIIIYFIARSEKLYENLELALKWNKIDVAINDIFNGREQFSTSQLNKLIESNPKK